MKTLSPANQGNSLARFEYLTFNRTICTSCTCESVGESASFRLPRTFCSLFVCSEFGEGRQIRSTFALPGVPRSASGKMLRQWQRCGAAATSFDQMPAKAPLDALVNVEEIHARLRMPFSPSPPFQGPSPPFQVKRRMRLRLVGRPMKSQ